MWMIRKTEGRRWNGANRRLRVFRNTCGERETKRGRFWEHAQRISWKCHSHSVQTIDFGVTFKATFPFHFSGCFPAKDPSLNSNKIALQMLSYCTVSCRGQAAWGERRGRYNVHPPNPTACPWVCMCADAHVDTLGYTQRARCWNRQWYFGLSLALCLVQMKMERGCSFCLEM